MTAKQREPEVVNAFVSLTDSLLDDFDVVDLMTQLTGDCARLLDVASAGLLLADARGELHVLAATSDEIQDLELFQIQRDEGPCRDCYHTGEPISVEDLRTEQARWPQFVPAAIEGGFASVHAVPMRARRTVLGVLGLFGTSVGNLNAEDLNLGQALAYVATVALMQDHSAPIDAFVPRFQAVLNNRGVVEQAKGVIYETYGLSMGEAFGKLRDYAHEHDEHLSDVARNVVSRPGGTSTVLRALAPGRTEDARRN
jgi:GAF domain-containing protein/ANTAR domain-containing protein